MVGLSLGLISAMSSWELPSILFQWCSHANTWLQACKVLYTDDCPHSMFHRNPASKGIPPRARHDDHHAASILILKATLPDWHRPPSLAFLSQERRKRRERNGCWFAFASASSAKRGVCHLAKLYQIHNSENAYLSGLEDLSICFAMFQYIIRLE